MNRHEQATTTTADDEAAPAPPKTLRTLKLLMGSTALSTSMRAYVAPTKQRESGYTYKGWAR